MRKFQETGAVQDRERRRLYAVTDGVADDLNMSVSQSSQQLGHDHNFLMAIYNIVFILFFSITCTRVFFSIMYSCMSTFILLLH